MNEQNFSNHAKFVPLFHAFVIPVLVINLGVHIYSLFKYSMNTPYFVFVGIFSVVLAVALLVLAFLARIFALGRSGSCNPARRALALRKAAARRSDAANRRIHYRPTGLAAIRERCGTLR